MTIEKLEELREHKTNAIAILEEESEYDTAKAVEMAFNALFALDQIMWERNVAIGQLEELGIGFGQKFGCEHCMFKRMSDRNLWCDIFDKIMPEDGYCSFFEFDHLKT